MNDPRRHAWSRPGLEGRRRCPCSTNCSVSETLAFGTDQSLIRASSIIEAEFDAVVISEVEFGEIPFQVRFADMEVTAVDATLQDGEEALDRVGVGFVPDILFLGMVDGLVSAFEGGADRGVDVGLIGHEPAIRMGMSGDHWIEVAGGHVRDVETTDPSATLHQGDDGMLRWDRTEGAVAGFAAHVGFVRLDRHARASHWLRHEWLEFFHTLPDPMAQEPGGFHAATKSPLDLTSSKALLAAGHEVDDLKPNMQRDVAGLEDRSHANGEGLPAGVALPKSRSIALTAQPPGSVQRAALWADRPIRPEFRLDISEGGGFTLELGGGQFGLHGGLLLDRQSTDRGWSCQV